MAYNYNLYISHSWKKNNELIRLRSLLENRAYFPVEFLEASPDQPINSQNESYIRHRLAQKIAKADVLLVMAGIYATTSDWIAFELQVARSLGIPIIGVVPWGQSNISSTVRSYAVDIVGWNTESVVKSVRYYSK